MKDKETLGINIKDKKNDTKNHILSVMLVLILGITIALIIFIIKYREEIENNNINTVVENCTNTTLQGVYDKGVSDGYDYFVGALYQTLAKCEPTPVTYKNETLTMVATECLLKE